MKRLGYLKMALTIAAVMAVCLQTQAKTYLGVATVPTNPEVSDHLKLDQGVGLTVVQVDPESAAAQAVEPKDIIVKLDDQILIDPRQLAILVRNREPGAKVALEIYRHGNKIEKKVELGETEDLPELQPRGYPGPIPFGPPARQFRPAPRSAPRGGGDDFLEDFQSDLEQRVREFRDSFGGMNEMLERLREQMRSDGDQEPQVFRREHSSVDITRIENGKRYHYTRENGDQHLEVTDANGDVVFDGPINTEEELEEVPRDALQFLDSIDRDVDYEPEEETELIPSNAI